MSVDTLHWALHTHCDDPFQKLVLILMADDADKDHVALIEPHLFASACHLSLDDLRRVMVRLLERGLIERVKDDPRATRQTVVAFRLQGYDA